MVVVKTTPVVVFPLIVNSIWPVSCVVEKLAKSASTALSSPLTALITEPIVPGVQLVPTALTILQRPAAVPVASYFNKDPP